ncbi:DUF3987 domain-containing protein [Legionella pneumophila]
MNNDELKPIVKALVEQYAKKELQEGYKPQALHVYDDEAGNLIYFRPRLKHPNGKKWIRPFHFDLTKQEWVQAEPAFNGNKPLYHLHALVKNTEAEVWVVEGEQKVDYLEKFGFIATTSGSCTSALTANWEPLQGRRIKIWPDNNVVGFQYGQEVKKILEQLGCTIQIVDAASLDLPDGGDIVDWLKNNQNATRDDICNLPILNDTTLITTTEDEWPQLVPLDAPNLPRLNFANLPSWLGEYANALSNATETPLELAAGMVLITCATAAARRLKVMVKPGYYEPCNLWVVVALPPGNRKSAVQSAATAPLISWEHDQAAILEPIIKRTTSEIKTIEARVKELRNKSAKEKDPNVAKTLAQDAADLEAELPTIPVSPQLWTSDATPERLGSLLAEQGEHMAWLSSEGGVFDLLQGRYSNGIPNLDLVLKSHSGDPERVDRGSRPPVYLSNPLLSIGLSPQPDVLRGLTNKQGFRGRGLLGRFLYLLPPSPLGFRKLVTSPIPDDVFKNYESAVKAMLNWEALPETSQEQLYSLRLSDRAYSEWHDFALAIEDMMRPGGDMEHFTDLAGKVPGAGVRLAGILHAVKHAHGRPWDAVITFETMRDALDIITVIIRHSIAALDLMGADPAIAAARQVLAWIVRKKLPTFTIREAFNALRSIFPKVQQLIVALEILEERGYIKVDEPLKKGPGRPASPVIYVNDKIVEEWL